MIEKPLTGGVMEGKYAILIVDDNVDLADSLRDVLETEDYSIAVANDGQAAIALHDKNAFDLALVDIRLPDMSGADLINKLAGLSPRMEYIIITGYASINSAIDAVGQRNIVGYLTKPLNMDHVLVTCNQALARKRAEEALRESEERYRSVFSEARDGITIVDMETGSIADCNPEFEKQTGRTLKQLKKMKIWEIITPEKASAAKKKFIEIQRSGTGGSADLEIQKPNGELVFIEFRSKRLGIQGGKYTQSISRDITERKKADEERIAIEQKAQVSSRLASVGEMAAGIAHEINNPLTGVIGFAHLLSKRDIPEDMRDDVEIISESAKRVSDIVKRMLTFARPQKGRRECIDIKQLVETTLALRAYELETNNIEVTTMLDPDLPLTLADGGQLQQVFLNMIINAETEMKLAHGRGKLSVKAEKTGNTILISFKDDGPGITEENMAKLFNPFFTTREVGQGTGLGLSVCHGIIKEHNGQIYAESELGKGATFIVELPIVVEEKQLGLAELAAEEAEGPKGKILVVDDEPTVREFLTKLLAGKGHEVDSVGSASDALTMIKSERYGVILLDIKMPGMSGNELYQRVQKIAKSLAKRIVFVTGDVMGIDTMDFLAKAGAHYISKPIDVEELMKTINEILS